MRHRLLVAVPGAFLAISLAALGVAALGSDILAPALEAIDTNMPDEAKETSGVTDVLEGVGERLDDIAAGEAGMPEDLPDDAGVPTELPPEEADIPIEMPAESEEWLDLAESYLETVPA